MTALTFTNEEQTELSVTGVSSSGDANPLLITRGAEPIRLTITWEGSGNIKDTKLKAAVMQQSVAIYGQNTTEHAVSGYIDVTLESTDPLVLNVSARRTTPRMRTSLIVQLVDENKDSQLIGFNVPVTIK